MRERTFGVKIQLDPGYYKMRDLNDEHRKCQQLGFCRRYSSHQPNRARKRIHWYSSALPFRAAAYYPSTKLNFKSTICLNGEYLDGVLVRGIQLRRLQYNSSCHCEKLQGISMNPKLIACHARKKS